MGTQVTSCADCPSFVAETDTQAHFGRNIGASMCARRGIPLDSSKSNSNDKQKSYTAIAGKCDHAGDPRPAKADAPYAPAVAVMSPVKRVIPDKPTSCSDCRNFIPDHVVSRELGWHLPMCAARGQLLYPKAVTMEPAECAFAEQGVRNDSTDGVTLLPQFEAAPNPALARKKRAGSFDLDAEKRRHAVDPRTYATDKPVTDDEKAVNIRAWRRVESPEGFEPVFMPIFDGPKLCGFDPRDTYGSHRPDLYVDHQAVLYDLAVEMIGLDETPVLIGSAGTGKTEVGCYMAYLMDVPFHRISIDKGTEPYHLLGEKVLKIDDATGQPITEWKDGRLSSKITEPGVIMVDEPNLKSEIFETLRPLFDSAKQLVIDADQGRRVERSAFTFLMCSQNPEWDPIYAGAEPMSAADMDRITPFYFDLPTYDLEKEIITKHCESDGYAIDPMTLDKIMLIAGEIRALIADGTLMISWGLRAQIKVARKTRHYSLEKAYRRAVIDGLDPDTVEQITSVVRSHQ